MAHRILDLSVSGLDDGRGSAPLEAAIVEG
jgi:hypothetical protein